ELLNVVSLQRFDHGFAFRRIAGVDEHGLARGRRDENRIAIDLTNVENANGQFTAGSRRRLCAPPGKNIFPADKSAGQGDCQKNCNCATTASSSSSQSEFLVLKSLEKHAQLAWRRIDLIG